MQSTNTLRTVVVTGANKGIGYAIVEKLLQGSNGYDVVLTARNPKLGEEAYTQLSQKYTSSSSKLTFQPLNISDSSSIDTFVGWLKAERNGKVDVLVNNAGIASKAGDVEGRLNTIDTNFTKTVEITEKVLPHLANDGKIIMVSSQLGELNLQGPEIQKFLTDPNLTKEDLEGSVSKLVEATKNLSHTSLGWSNSAYNASKVLLNAYTRWVLAKLVKGDQQCYTLHPGWCKTDMGGERAPETAEDGAETPIYLINLPFKADEKLNGQFFEKSKIREW